MGGYSVPLSHVELAIDEKRLFGDLIPTSPME